MTSAKKNNLTKTTEKVGKALARSTFKAESAGKVAQKKVKELLGKVFNWFDDTMDAVNEAKGSKPDIKNKKEPLPSKHDKEKLTTEQFSHTADAINTYLDKNGMVATTRLINAIMHKKNSKANVLAAIDWLTNEDKLQFSEDGERVSLK